MPHGLVMYMYISKHIDSVQILSLITWNQQKGNCQDPFGSLHIANTFSFAKGLSQTGKKILYIE